MSFSTQSYPHSLIEGAGIQPNWVYGMAGSSVRLLPHPALRNYITCYRVLEHIPRSAASEWQMILPNGNAELLFQMDGQVHWKPLQEGKTAVFESGFITGASENACWMRPEGYMAVIGVRFKATGPRRLIGTPSVELGTEPVSLDHLLGGKLTKLQEKLKTTITWHERIMQLDAYFLEQLAASMPSSSVLRLEQAVQEIVRTDGKCSVGDLAELTCLSERQFLRIFKAEMGIGPKTYLRLLRINRLITHAVYKDLSIGDLLHDNGYYDHSHFNHDFKLVTGVSPTDYFARAKDYSRFMLS